MSSYKEDAKRLHSRICDQGFYTESNRADMQTITMMLQVEVLEKLEKMQGDFNALAKRVAALEAAKAPVPKVKMGGPPTGP